MPQDNPRIPHLIGITLDSNGVAGSQVIAINRSNSDRQIKATNSDKLVIFDASDFPTQFAANNVIEFQNVGSSWGSVTVTINGLTGGFQEATLTAAAAPTVSVNL